MRFSLSRSKPALMFQIWKLPLSLKRNYFCLYTVCVMQLYWNSLGFYWSCCASLPMKNVRVSVLVVSNRSSRGVRDRSVFRFSPRPAGAFEGCRKYLWYAKATKRRGCFTARRCSPGSQVEVLGEKKIIKPTRSHCDWKIHKTNKTRQRHQADASLVIFHTNKGLSGR